MKKLNITITLLAFLLLAGMKITVFAQTSPVMYFCERYDADRGEIGISDRFSKGYLTVMVKAEKPMGLREVHIQFDKYSCYNGKFEFYKKYNFTVEPDMKYIFFTHNDESDMKFDETGFYRVFLLDDHDDTITSALIEIID